EDILKAIVGRLIQDMKEENWQENMEIPFHTPEDTDKEWYKYECPKCGEEDEVPGYVIDEFAMGKDLKEGEMPGVACPECGAEMKFKYTFER
ncbi:MAG: hypothetical protein ACLFSO_01200, partial [Halanaerobium sp.]